MKRRSEAIRSFTFKHLAGALNSAKSGTSYLLACETVEKANAETVSQFINESLRLLWPDRIEYGRVLLLVSDAAAYMKCAYKALKVLYPKMLHVTCLAHALHLIRENIRSTFSVANILVSEVKRVFNKAPNRVNTKQ